MKQLLENWRRYLKEITTLSPELYSSIEQAIENSLFWEEPNDEDSLEMLSRRDDLGTPATEKLEKALQQLFDSLNVDIQITVESSPDDAFMVGPEHPYPSRWLTGGNYFIHEGNKKRLALMMALLTDDYDLGELNTGELAKHIAQTIRHELVHAEQIKKYAKSKGISEYEAFTEIEANPKLIPPQMKMVVDPETGEESEEEDPEWSKKYYASHIEIDSYAHEFAEALIDQYGPKNAIDAIRHFDVRLFDFERFPDPPPTMGDMIAKLKNNPKALNDFRKKLYKQIVQQSKASANTT